MKKILTIFLLLSFIISFAQTNHRRERGRYSQNAWESLPAIVHLPNGYTSDSLTKKYALLMFFHGAGEAGATDGSQLSRLWANASNGPAYFIEQGTWPDSFRIGGTGEWVKFIVVSPQFPGWSAAGDQAAYFTKWAVEKYAIDTTRIYASGLSAGGIGTVNFAARSVASSGSPYFTVVGGGYRPAAIVPMSQADAATTGKAANIVSEDINTWGFGSLSETHGIAQQNQVNYINAISPGKARFTSYSGGHCCWGNFYTPSYKETIGGQSMNIYEWMLLSQRTAANGPVVSAGADQTISLPNNSVTLSGSITTPGAGATLTGVQWTRISGPSTPTFTAGTSNSTSVTGLIAGTYVFRFTATNNSSLSGYDEVTVTVNDLNPTITVNNPSITLPTSTAGLTSTPVTNYTITSRRWTKFKANSQPTLKITAIGSSTFAGSGPSHPDSAVIRRLRKFYIDAGIIADITNLAIGGTSVFDANITTALNTGCDVLLINYPSNGYNGSTYTITQIAQRYQMLVDSCLARGKQVYLSGTQPRGDFGTSDQTRLKVINDTLRNRFGARFMDFFTPLAQADNTFKEEYKVAGDNVHVNNYAHRQLFEVVKGAGIFQNIISIPGAISTPTTQNTNVTGLTQGTWQYQHSFMDNRGYWATGISTVTVNAAGNIPPVANAGSDQTITLPTSTGTLAGSGTDADGSIASYAWSKVSGPTPGAIVNSAIASTTVTGLVTGVYVFRLTVTDNLGLTHADDKTITVLPEETGPDSLYVKAVGATEYDAFWLYSNDSVYVTAFNATNNRVEVSPINLGGKKAKAVHIGFNRPLILDEDSMVWVGGHATTVATKVLTDTTGAPFNGIKQVAGHFYAYCALKSDGSIWYWGADDYNLFAGSNQISQPIKLSPNGVVFTKIHMGNSIMALTSAGVVYQWFKNGSLTATQKTFPRPAIDIFGGYADVYGAIVPDAGQPTTSGYPYVWGTSFGHWGGTEATSTPVSVKTLWEMTVPVSKIDANQNTIAYIDTTGRLYTMGYNSNGELGNGYEYVNQSELYETPYNWNWEYIGLSPKPTWIRQDKRFKSIYTSNTFTFYWWAIDSSNVAYHWGRTKSFVGGNGVSSNQEANFPNGIDILTPTARNPITSFPVTFVNWQMYTLNAGADKNLVGTSTTLSATGIPTTYTQIAGWTWSIVSAPPDNVGGHINNPSAQTTEVTGLTPGTYIFNVQMRDTNNGTISDQVTVTVTAPESPYIRIKKARRIRWVTQ